MTDLTRLPKTGENRAEMARLATTVAEIAANLADFDAMIADGCFVPTTEEAAKIGECRRIVAEHAALVEWASEIDKMEALANDMDAMAAFSGKRLSRRERQAQRRVRAVVREFRKLAADRSPMRAVGRPAARRAHRRAPARRASRTSAVPSAGSGDGPSSNDPDAPSPPQGEPAPARRDGARDERTELRDDELDELIGILLRGHARAEARAAANDGARAAHGGRR